MRNALEDDSVTEESSIPDKEVICTFKTNFQGIIICILSQGIMHKSVNHEKSLWGKNLMRLGRIKIRRTPLGCDTAELEHPLPGSRRK